MSTLKSAAAGFVSLVAGAFMPEAIVFAAPPSAMSHANTISLQPHHPDSYTRFAPELPRALARMPTIDREIGVHVEEIADGFFYVTDGIYQSAFLTTDEGVIVLDAPPSIAPALRGVIDQHAPDQPIKYLVYSHDHSDHIGGAEVFADVDGLTIITAKQVAENLRDDPLRGVLPPTKTFSKQFKIKLGDEIVQVTTASFHSEDQDVIIYLPRQKILMAIDTITAGEVPFMNFGATSDVGRYTEMFDELLAYDFDHIISGHISILGNRQDVIDARDYTYDVRDAVASRMPTLIERLNNALAAIDYKNANVAYRIAMESIRDECAAEVINKWQDTLSVVDVWADSHCETFVLYYVMH